MASENDPHANEYAAAVAGMAETYGRSGCQLPSVGDRIAYRLKSHTETEWEAGRVVRVQDIGPRPLIVVETEDEKTLRVIDGRPWPTGSVLPF